MKNFLSALAIAFTFTATASVADPSKITSLEDYTFDFATLGYEVVFSGIIYNYSETLENGDYVWLRDGGYNVKVSFDALSRKSKHDLTNVFNENCVGYDEECAVTVSGEVQLDEDMQVLVIAREVTLEGRDYK